MSGTRTKDRIFKEAVRLFSERGYAETTIRQIASAVQVNEATIYIYFSSKADILAEILNAFEKKLDRYLPTKQNMDSRIAGDEPQKCLGMSFWFCAIEDDLFMRQAFRIVCMEQFANERAGALVRDKLRGEVTENIRYALDKLIACGKISDFDTHSFSALWAGAMFSSAVMAVHGESEEVSSSLWTANQLMLDMAIGGKVPDSVSIIVPNQTPDVVASGV